MKDYIVTREQIIYDACELVESSRSFPSCLAICQGVEDKLNIRGQYEQFLDLDYFDVPGWDYFKDLKSTRILTLLLFLECGDWVLAGDS